MVFYVQITRSSHHMNKTLEGAKHMRDLRQGLCRFGEMHFNMSPPGVMMIPKIAMMGIKVEVDASRIPGPKSSKKHRHDRSFLVLCRDYGNMLYRG